MSFVAKSFAGDIKGLTKLIVQAVRWPGFSFIEVHSPCVTYRGHDQYQLIRERARPVPEDHDTGDRAGAFRLADDPDHLYLGVIFQRENSTFGERMDELRVHAQAAGRVGFDSAVSRFAV